MLIAFEQTKENSGTVLPGNEAGFNLGSQEGTKSREQKNTSDQSAFGQREEESVTRKELVTKLAREIRIGARVIDIKKQPWRLRQRES